MMPHIYLLEDLTIHTAIMGTKSVVTDPVHGTIEMPDWLVKISKENSVRRMMFIRQLGLKAYIDYPGAIHTRYSHVLGVMHLAGRVIDLLSSLEFNKGRTERANNLRANKHNIMAAGFLHDIGHGPFSHVVDYILKRYASTTHEDIAFEIIKKFDDLENNGITITKVRDIITGKHDYPFINQIVNGPIDADKLDYLLRDAHHVGLKYSLDLDHFINNFRLLGIDDSELKRCELGLVNEPEALVTAEIFIVMWKSMYDLVYHIENSRIAEKMLEKAIILKCEIDEDFKSNFTAIDKFVALDDAQLLEFMKDQQGLISDLVKGVHDNKLYRKPYDELVSPAFSMNEKFLSVLEKNSDDLSDKISIKFCEYAKCEKYEIICDIVKSRIPKPIHLDSYEEKSGDPMELKLKSDIISAIKEKIRIKVYTRTNLPKSVDKNFINKGLEEIICGWN